ncbi:MAG: holo-ACP synthase [Mycobacteriales bacterium]
MIVGIGLDVVDLARFRRVVQRSPGVLERLFTVSERATALTLPSWAARFAAKEALAKSLGAPAGLRWHDVEVRAEASGRPGFAMSGSVAAVAGALGVKTAWLSMSHDGAVAMAVVVAEA